MTMIVLVICVLTLGEVLALGTMLVRNRYFDRLNSVMLAPFVLLMAIQVALWPHISAETNAMDCSDTNRRLSLLATCVFVGVPFWLVGWSVVHALVLLPLPPGLKIPDWVAAATLLHGTWLVEWPRRMLTGKPLKMLFKCLGASFWFFVLSIVFTAIRHSWRPALDSDGPLYVRFFAGPICTTRGPYGNLVWPAAVHAHWVMEVLWSFACLNISGHALYLLQRPSFLFPLLKGGIFISLFMAFFIAEEWASVMCSLASIGCFICLFEPTLIRRHRVFDAEAMQPGAGGEQARMQDGFLFAWSVVLPHSVPWHEQEEQKADEANMEPPLSAEEHGDHVPVMQQMMMS